MEMRHTHYPQGLLMSPPGGLDYLKMPMQAMQLGPNGELIPTGMQTHHHGPVTTGKLRPGMRRLNGRFQFDGWDS